MKISLFLMIFIVTAFLFSASASATWLLDDYDYRQSITLTGNTSGAQTDYQLLLNVSYDSDMQIDFDDLRFTNDTYQIDAWLESNTTNYAFIWVEFPTTPANEINQTYYMYYGNDEVASDWDIGATFIDGWDFESDTIGNVPAGWIEDAAYGSLRTIAGKAIKMTHIASEAVCANHYVSLTPITCDNNRAIEMEVIPRLAADYSYAPFLHEGTAFVGEGMFMALRYGYFSYYTTEWNNILAFNANQTYKMSFYNIDLTNDQFDLDIDGENYLTNAAFRATQTQIDTLAVVGSGGEDCENDWDNIRVRKYTAGPATYIFGSEEFKPFLSIIVVLQEIPKALTIIKDKFFKIIPFIISIILFAGFGLAIMVMTSRLKKW